MRLVAIQVQFVSNWPPVALNFCKLAASTVQKRQFFESTLPEQLFE
jgi:hypothetical protein